MSTERLFDKIRNRMGENREVRLDRARARFNLVNAKLETQLDAQAMTPKLLAKACSL